MQKVDDLLGGVIATVELSPVRVARTRSIKRKKVMKFQESFRIFCGHLVTSIDVFVYSGDVYLGRAKVAVTDHLLDGEKVDGWYELTGDHEGIAKFHIVLQFTHAMKDRHWNAGVAGGAFEGISHALFPMRKGCKLVPYQNSHIDETFNPKIMLANGQYYKPEKAWEAVYHAMDAAKHFIYVAGWSVNASIALVRDKDGKPLPGHLGETLGELLVRKANEGVTVLMLVWDDKTDNTHLLTGIMNSHDEDTFAYFRNTKVHCLLCPRNPQAKEFKLVAGFIFTHHQKVVCMDAPALPSFQRRVLAFQGGIDLCDGRYCFPAHPLFQYLDTLFKNDFHQGSIVGAASVHGGPREPWHDCYTKLEGEIAWDVHENFRQRWLKQAGKLREHLLVSIANRELFCPPSPATTEEDPESWNVQLFRSLDTTSGVDLPQDQVGIFEAGLVRQAAGNVTERSIQDAYIEGIRRAKRFLYIENQYFLGSSHMWEANFRDESAAQLIPLEIALKVASKIRAGEEFSVFIVNPLWPDGAPTSLSGQDIMLFHRKTLEMMYRIIHQALIDMNRAHEDMTDYLSFYCLGNRETVKPNEYVPPQPPNPETDYHKSQKNRRFMIYCHAKMMVGKYTANNPELCQCQSYNKNAAMKFECWIFLV